MRIVFADTGYWIARTNPDDQLHDSAVLVTLRLGELRIVTSEMVLVEFLNFMGRQGEHKRRLAADALREIMDNPNVDVIPQTSRQFRAAADLYEDRPDQRWSVTDCSSFLIMREMGINEALAHDRDFAQAGFRVLL